MLAQNLKSSYMFFFSHLSPYPSLSSRYPAYQSPAKNLVKRSRACLGL